MYTSIYFADGIPKACSYSLNKTVPSNAVFTNTWRGIQNNLTSTSTSDSLSAYQGKLLNDKINKTWTRLYFSIDLRTKHDLSSLNDYTEIHVVITAHIGTTYFTFPKTLIKGLDFTANRKIVYFTEGCYYSSTIYNFCGICIKDNNIWMDTLRINGTDYINDTASVHAYIFYR